MKIRRTLTGLVCVIVLGIAGIIGAATLAYGDEGDSLPMLDLNLPEAYVHQIGELAVVLDWAGDFDLDLEIWTEDMVYIGDAYALGDSADISHGDQGSEWFIFQSQSDIDDFSQGRYVVSPYFAGPQTDQGVLATLTVFLPHGERMVLERELFYDPPQDQWFAVLVDADQGKAEVLDFFEDPSPMGTATGSYEHQLGELAVVLDWAGDFDLDLEIWSEEFRRLGYSYELGETLNITHGDQGVEWMVFKDYPGIVDLGQGRYLISPFFEGPETEQGVVATLTVFLPDGEQVVLERELFYYHQWFAVLVDADQATVEVLDLIREQEDFLTSGSYEHQIGELAVVLDWAGDFDLDLEIWSEDTNYIGNAFFLGDSPDITQGDLGEEWFVFKAYPGEVEDFSQGRYTVAAFRAFSADPGQPVLATLTVYFPNGESLVMEKELYSGEPYDRWYPVLVDVERGEVEKLDHYDG